MANLILYKSSCISGFVHLLFFILYIPTNLFLISIMVIGLCTSIFNHKYTNKLLQYLDRFVMIIGFLCNLYFIYNMCNLSHIGLKLFLVNLLLCSVCLYFNAKNYIKNNYTNYSNILHILAHILLTFIHIILISRY